MQILTTSIVALLLYIAGIPAVGDVALKPRGEKASPLRTRSLNATVRIEKQRFATTDLDIVFHNELHERIEADFMYTVPDGAVVTDFAYYYGDERVVARITEKERAAAIYRHITSRMRDPALVEMVGKNRFQARIFPVMPDADLRVQIRYVQALPIENGRATYTLPMPTLRADSLESVAVSVAAPGADPQTLKNNLGIAAQLGSENTARLTFKGKNYRSAVPFRVSLPAAETPLTPGLFAARSGGSDGFFALALTLPSHLTRPEVMISGVPVYALEQTKVPGGFLVCGRYKGSGAANATVIDGDRPVSRRSISLMFPDTTVPANPATYLWASAHIARLSEQKTNEKTVVALSHRFGLPSKWTSWLAIPKAELELYKQEKALADLELVGKQIAALYARRRENSAEARRLRVRLGEIAKILGYTPSEALRNQLSDRMHEIVTNTLETVESGQEQTANARQLRGEAKRLAHFIGTEWEQEVRRNATWRLDGLVDRYIQGKYGYYVVRWYNFYGNSSVETRSVRKLAPAETKVLRQRIDRLCRFVGIDPARLMRIAESPYRVSEAEGLRDQIVVARKAKQPDTGRITAMERKFIELSRNDALGRDTGISFLEYAGSPTTSRFHRENSPDGREAWAKDRLARIAARAERELLEEQLKTPLSAEEKAQKEARRAEAARKEAEIRARMGDPLISVEAPEDARNVVAIMPDGTIKPLAFDPARHRWEARFDIPTYAAEGAYTVTVIVVRTDGTRETQTVTYTVDTSAPDADVRLTRFAEGRYLIQATAASDTARILAVLPDGSSLTLTPDAGTPGQWSGRFNLSETTSGTITVIVTDRAHNRTCRRVAVPTPGSAAP